MHGSHALPKDTPLPQPATSAYLLLDVAGVVFALPRAGVSEVLPLPHLQRPALPGTLLAGVLNLGGASVPVVDLARLLDLRAADAVVADDDPYRHLVVAADGAMALLVDRVLDLVLVAPSAIRPLAEGASVNACIAAEIAQGDTLIHALAMDRLLTAEESRRIDVLAQAAQARLSVLDRLASA